jgi:hypothetical protein
MTHDNIHQMVAQLEKRGVAVRVGCSHLGWQVTTASGEEITRYASAREVVPFLTGLLCANTMSEQLNA